MYLPLNVNDPLFSCRFECTDKSLVILLGSFVIKQYPKRYCKKSLVTTFSEAHYVCFELLALRVDGVGMVCHTFLNKLL
jgi:hypothetical protein